MRVLLFTGKGGVGKTTAAAASAVRLADRGTKTLVVSTDAAHSLGDAMAVRLAGDPVEVLPSLWAAQIDSQRRFEASWHEVQSYLLQLLDRAGVDPVTADELAVLPGIEEVLSLLAVRDYAEDGDWDVIVVDCAPTAETLRLLALPEALSWYLAKVFPAHRRIARGMRPLASLLGRGEVIPPDSIFSALLRLSEELSSVRELLADPQRTTVRLVLTPEAVVCAEALRTFTALSLFGYRVDAAIANRVFPASDDPWQAGWVAAQRVQLDELHARMGDLPVCEVPYRAAEPIGLAALRQVADHLYGSLPGTDPAVRTPGADLLRVAEEGDGFVLRMSLPLTTRSDVGLARSGDDLIVEVGGHRRVLTLPSVLRRCDVVGGDVVDAELVVRFRPDPDVWPKSGGGR